MTQTARVYAGALYDLAGSEGLEDRILGDLALFSQLLRENGDYLRLLCTPSIPKKIGKITISGSKKRTCRVKDTMAPNFAFPIEVKKPDTKGCIPFRNVKNI